MKNYVFTWSYKWYYVFVWFESSELYLLEFVKNKIVCYKMRIKFSSVMPKPCIMPKEWQNVVGTKLEWHARRTKQHFW